MRHASAAIAISLSAVASLAAGSAPAATYQLTTLANTATPAGDGFDLIALSVPSYTAGRFVFAGASASGFQAIYTVAAAGGALTRLVDTETAVPGGSGPFTGNDAGYLSAFKPPGACMGPVTGPNWASFFGYDATNGYGLYALRLASGKVVKLADPNTPYPDAPVAGEANYSGFCSLSASRDVISFDADGGVYGARPPAAPFRTADANTPAITASSHAVKHFLQPSVSGTNVAYVGATASAPYGIYAGPTTMLGAAVVTTASADPRGSGTLSDFWNPVLFGEKVLFHARTNNVSPVNEGLYVAPISGANAGRVVRIVDLRSVVPGTSGGSFSDLGGYDVNQTAIVGGYVAFVASAQTAKQRDIGGLYESCRGELAKVLTVGDALPDGDTVRAVWGISTIGVVSTPGGTADLFGVSVDGSGTIGRRLYAVMRLPAC